jgi:putative OmpL-like beta-barrel porin-2
MTGIGGLFRRTVVPALASLALAASPAWAEGPEPAVDPTPAPPAAAEPEATPPPPAPRVDVAGFVDVYYGYNFNKVPPALRTFDVQHNAFSLSQTEIAFSKLVTTESRLGFRADIGFGKTADIVASLEPEEDGQGIYKNIQQAYLSALVGKRLTVDLGKFVTPIGAEVIESQDNWNYSRSVLFGYAIPFYHTGIRGTFAANDKLSVQGLILNGWNNSSEIRDGRPGVGFGATVKPNGNVTWIGNFMFGPEAPVPDPDTRYLFDTTLTVALSPRLSFMGNFDYGSEGPTTWWGVAAYAKLQATDKWTLAGRYEYLDDTDGGFMTIGQKAQTFTLTSDHTIAGSLKARLEYRFDTTDGPFFAEKDSILKKDSQSTVTVGLVYLFGSKI